MTDPIFSLVLCTKGRVAELARFLESLVAQRMTEVQVIIVDQNDDDRLMPVLNDFRDKVPLEHIRTATGLSLGRNEALKRVRGAIVGFPDDDCVYPHGLLRRLFELANLRSEDFFSFASAGLNGGLSGPRQEATDTEITASNVWRCVISYTFFVRSRCLQGGIRFDTDLGVGSPGPYKSGEETDFVLQLLRAGYRGWHVRDMCVLHPEEQRTLAHARKRWAYGCGTGFVYVKDRLGALATVKMLVGPLVRFLCSLLCLRAMECVHHGYEFAGRVRGVWGGMFRASEARGAGEDLASMGKPCGK